MISKRPTAPFSAKTKPSGSGSWGCQPPVHTKNSIRRNADRRLAQSRVSVRRFMILPKFANSRNSAADGIFGMHTCARPGRVDSASRRNQAD